MLTTFGVRPEHCLSLYNFPPQGTKHCTSWYRNEEGFNWTFWPTNLITFWWSTLWFDKEKYDLTDVECQLRE